jgi:hypothetical protein
MRTIGPATIGEIMQNRYARARGNHDIDDARYYADTKAKRQADWLARFADAVVTIDARHAGRIEWSSAKHFYFEGLTVDDAAKRYAENRPCE